MLSRTKKATEVRLYYLSLEKLVRRYNFLIQEELYKKIGILEKNQKPKTQPKGGVIYIMQAQNSDITLYKLGKTKDLRNRLNTYNSGNANDVEPLFIIQVKDIDAVENCIKAVVKRCQYRKYKEVYECDLQVLKDAIIGCDELNEGIKKKIQNKKGKTNLNKIKKGGKKLFFGIFKE